MLGAEWGGLLGGSFFPSFLGEKQVAGEGFADLFKFYLFVPSTL